MLNAYASPSSPDKEVEPWRKELQDIAKAAGLNTTAEEKPKQPTAKRTSQYSAETGRLIPPPTKGYSRQSSRMKTQEQFINSFNSQRGNPLDEANAEDTVSYYTSFQFDLVNTVNILTTPPYLL